MGYESSGNMLGMFRDMPSLTSLDVSKWDVSSVTSMVDMFSDASSLSSLDVSNWNLKNVKELYYMFRNCTSLRSLDVSGWNTSNIENMGLAFKGCSSLSSIDVSNWDTSKVAEMWGIFAGCSQLEFLDFSNWNTTHTSFKEGYGDWPDTMFESCSSLKEVRYNSDCENLISLLPSDWQWYQNDEDHGPYVTSEIPALSQGESATLIKFEGSVNPPVEDDDKGNNSTQENNKPNEGDTGSSDAKEEDDSSTSNKDDVSKPNEGSNDSSEDDNSTSSKEDNNDPKPTEDIKDPILPVEDEDKNDSNSSKEDDNKLLPPTEADDKPNLDGDNDNKDKEEDPNLKDDNKPKPPVNSDLTPTQTGDSSTVVVDLYIKNNKALEGIHTEEGELPEEELRILETYLNTTPNYNPNDYSVTIVNASVSKNTSNNEKYNFELTVAITLKEESRINFVINKLEKKMKSEDAIVNESGLMILTLEEIETTPSYTVKEVRDKIIIEGLLVKDAFGKDNQIDGFFIKGILDDEGYDVSTLDFTSTQSKDSTFILHDLTSLISIELVSTDNTISSSTRPNSNNSSSKPYRYPIDKLVGSSTPKKTLYRLFNTLTGEHFFTSNESERNELLKDSRWSDEGQGWISPEISDFPIYRLVNPNNGDHHYTMDKNEYETLAQYGWQQEGIGLYSADSNDEDIIQLHRLYNPNCKEPGSHHYTVSEEERDNLVQQGWQYEGIAWYGIRN